MQKSTLLSAALSAMVALSIGLTSCKDDDDPFVPPTVSVGTKAVTVSEGAGTTSVEIVLNTPAASALTIEYSLGGTATSPADYSVAGREGEVQIAQGATSGKIEIQIVDDATFEGNETIVITLDDVTGGDATITNEDEAIVTIEENDQQVVASFATTSLTQKESDGIIEITVSLSQPASANATITYSVSGTARDSVSATNANPKLPADYAVRGGSPGTLQIPAGANSGIIRIGLYSDFVIEDGDQETEPWDPETIIMTLTGSTGVSIDSEKDELQIDVHQEDGKVIALFWDLDRPDLEDETTVDMDLFLWIGDIGTPTDELELISLSAFEGTEHPEIIFVPSKITEVKYGVTYTYWGGDVEPMAFAADFIDFADGALGGRETYEGTYTLDNLNPWETLDQIVHIQQTFEVNADGEFVNFSEITVPDEGSRVIPMKLPAGTKRSKKSPIGLRKF